VKNDYGTEKEACALNGLEESLKKHGFISQNTEFLYVPVFSNFAVII
jgi:hypothetical protein